MIDAIKACVAARKKHLEVDGSHNHTEEQHGCEIEVDVHPDYPEWRGIEVVLRTMERHNRLAILLKETILRSLER